VGADPAASGLLDYRVYAFLAKERRRDAQRSAISLRVMGDLASKAQDHGSSALAQLGARLGAQWSQLAAASERTRLKRMELSQALAGLDSADTSIVVFGSLARNEFTTGSDIDWTLLIDGQAAPEHLALANKIRDEIARLEAKPPGEEGIFGKLSFSHDIIHQIGGQNDTNANTTQRILLLLESCVLGKSDAHDRVLSNILNRYITEDRGLWYGSGHYKVPRFLLNDIARYWRTMAVDLAYKQRTRGGAGFALRTIKLRISRKLIYIAGLLSCFSYELGLDPALRRTMFDGGGPLPALAHLKASMMRSPLEITARALLLFPELDLHSNALFSAYDDFLGLLADDDKRGSLKNMPFEDLPKSPIFKEAQLISYRFRDAVSGIFLKPDNLLGKLTIEYGVF
jgi:predicted nucleotidyltransferase